MKKLTKNQIIMLHDELIKETGDSRGLRDEDLLDSALNVPFQSFDGTDAFRRYSRKPPVLGSVSFVTTRLLTATSESEPMQC